MPPRGCSLATYGELIIVVVLIIQMPQRAVGCNGSVYEMFRAGLLVGRNGLLVPFWSNWKKSSIPSCKLLLKLQDLV